MWTEQEKEESTQRFFGWFWKQRIDRRRAMGKSPLLWRKRSGTKCVACSSIPERRGNKTHSKLVREWFDSRASKVFEGR